jgi:predicted nucleic acid-binding protein
LKAVFDTNVVLDVLLEREPFLTRSAAILSQAEAGRIEGYLAATTFITLEYLAAKRLGRKGALDQLKQLLTFLKVATVDEAVIRAAIAADPRDFEDALIALAAIAAGVEAIVTRDGKGFDRFPVSRFSPGALLERLSAAGPQKLHENP